MLKKNRTSDNMIEILSYLIGIFSSLPTNLLVFIIMFLAAFLLPIPSETVIMALGTKVSLTTLLIYGSGGATLGSLMMYLLGRKLGKYVRKYHHIFLVDKQTLHKIEMFIKKHEKNAVLLGRAIPLIPHKLVSLVAGSFRINIKDFIIFGLVGMIIRLLLFFYSGKILSLNVTSGLIILAIIIALSYAARKKIQH